MPNTFNYADTWSPELIETFIQGTLISPFITTNVKFTGAKTFHFTQMSTSGFKTHSRAGGWNRGSVTQNDVDYTLTHDRDIEFLIDRADVDETNATASIQNAARTFTTLHAVPEADALFFSTRAQEALKLKDCHSSSKVSDWNSENVLPKLKKMISSGKLRRYRAMGALIMYVDSFVMDLLEWSESFTRSIEITQIAEGGAGIETRITDIDGVPVIEVIDNERFYSKFDFDPEDGGFEPASDGKAINVFIASPLTSKYVPKISTIYFFEPGAHTQGDGYLYQNRNLSGAFTFPNGKNNKIDSLYVDVREPEE